MSEITINSTLFSKRLAQLQAQLDNRDTFPDPVDTILVVIGSSDDDNPYRKSTVLHNWLLGYEFPLTLLAISKNSVTVLTSANKAKLLQDVEKLTKASGTSDFKLLVRSKDAKHNAALFTTFVDELKLHPNVGVFPKDKFEGKFYQDWADNYWAPNAEHFNTVDVSLLVSKVLEAKDEHEMRNMKTAARCSTGLMTFFTNEMIKVVDEEVKMANSKMSEKIENKIDDARFFKGLSLGADFDLANLDWCYNPIVQSGHDFDLKPSAQSNDANLGATSGSGVVITSSIGTRYKSYCSNVARTFLIDPTKEIEKNYDFLLLLEKEVVANLKPGTPAKDIYNKLLLFVLTQRPELEPHLLKNCGWLMGIDFKDSGLVLNGKNPRQLQRGAVVNVTVGLHNLQDAEYGSYSLVLSDTVAVQDEPQVLTPSGKSRAEISFYFKDEEDPQVKREEKKRIPAPKPAPETGNSKILKSKLRTETKNHDEDQEQLKKELQRRLLEQRKLLGMAKYDRNEDLKLLQEQKLVFKRYESYIRETQVPGNVRDLRIHIDSKLQTILVPISGRPVLFHVNAFKNASKNEEGEYTYLRLNFHSPGGVNTRKDELPYEESASAEFVRSLTFRSTDNERMLEVYRKITELKKAATKREQERKQMADVVTQLKLVETRSVGRGKRLDQVFVRPGPDSKRAAGYVEIHQNGLRYQSPLRSEQKIDLLFSNIKHLFFQPCKEELVVLIHCHLKTPIMIGKKKTRDVQFYRELSDMLIDETGNKKRRYRYGDEDELEQEQEERRRKLLLDKEFRLFLEQIADAGGLDLDIPFRELGFNGVPFRSAVFCMPTRDCLVQLIDPPFLVITLDEIEIVHLERVQFGLKNFDMVFVYKDFHTVAVNTVDVALLDDIRNWLGDVDIPVTQGPVNLNWGLITKTILADPYEFYANDAWSFLADDGGSDEEESEEEEEEFEPEPEDLEEETDDYDESSDSADEESDASDASEGSDASVTGESDEGSDGEIWSD